MPDSHNGIDEGAPDFSAAIAVRQAEPGARTSSLDVGRTSSLEAASDGVLSEWGSTRVEYASNQTRSSLNNLAPARIRAREPSKGGADDSSLAVAPRTTSNAVGDLQLQEVDTSVMARLRIYALKERLVGFLVRRPILSLLVLQLVLLVTVIVLSYEIVVDPNLEDFVYRGTNSSLYQSSYRHVWLFSRLAPRNQLDADAFGLIEGIPSADLFGLTVNTSATGTGLTYAHFSVHLIYVLSGGNVLTERTLYAIQQFEDALRARPLWQDLCNKSSQASAHGGSCDPGESLISFLWPQSTNRDPTPHWAQRAELLFNGQGSQWLPVTAVLGALAEGGEPLDRLRRFLPQDFALPTGGAAASADALQSHFLFSLPVGGPSVPGARFDSEEAAREAFHELLGRELHPALEGNQLLWDQGVRVYAHGPEVRRLEVELAWRRDCWLVLGSLIVAFQILCVRSKSIAIAAFGLLLVMESLPLSFVLFRLIAGTVRVNLPDLVALFLVIGLGSDVAIFEILDGWRDAAQQQGAKDKDGAPEMADLARRVSGSFEEAWHTRRMRVHIRCMWASVLPSCPVVTLYTAGSFLACLTSELQAFREVGLFLGLCVASAALLVAAMLPLALVALENWRFRRRLAQGRGNGTDESVPFNVGKLVPESEACPEDSFGPKPGGGMRARVLRLVEELWQAWVSSISTLRWWLFGALAAFLLTCFIGTLLAVRADSVFADLFGIEHHQVAGRQLLDRFGSSVAAVASSASSQDAYFCGMRSPGQDSEWENCRDSDLRCGAWASIGQCEQSSGFMQARCPRSCGLCSFCFMRHCRVPSRPPLPHTARTNGTCSCRAESWSFPAAKGTIVGLPAEAWPALRAGLRTALQGLVQPQTNDYDFLEAEPWKQPPVLQEHWRSGHFALSQSFEAPVLTRAGAPAPSPPAVNDVVCYCAGTLPCESTGGLERNFTYDAPEVRRLAAQAQRAGAPRAGSSALDGSSSAIAAAAGAAEVAGRRLLELDLRHANREVSITWGILVEEPGMFELFPRTQVQDSWQLDGMFDPGDPWVQRSLMAMSSNLPAELRASPRDGSGQTWLHLFEQWLLLRGQQFPSREFHSQVLEFLAEHPLHQRNILTDSGIVRAVRVVLDLDVPTSPPFDEILSLKETWDRHVEVNNRRAGLRARNAWHSSSLWVLVETHDAIVSSTWLSLAVTMAIVVVGAAVYTRDVQLTLLTSASIMSVILAQAFFMSVLLQVAFGVIEALALAALAGHAAAAGLRVAAAYGRPPPPGGSPATGSVAYGMRPEDDPASAAATDRYRRTLHALEATGWGILGSAGMMTGTGFFMLFGSLQFHVTFGVAVFSITALSLLHSLLFLPLVLLLVGPTPHGLQPLAPCRRRWRAWYADHINEPALVSVQPYSMDTPSPEPENDALEHVDSGHRAGSKLRQGRPDVANDFSSAGEVGHQAIATGSCLFLNGSNGHRRSSGGDATGRSDARELQEQGANDLKQDRHEAGDCFECVDL